MVSRQAAPRIISQEATPRERRQRALADARREHILAAARATFVELGLERASLREIAKRAGYTAGAIYSYFPSKEEVYAALLAESLDRLNSCVDAAAAGRSRQGKLDLRRAASELRHVAHAFFDFYQDNPRDLDLGFYLFQGMQPRGLTPQWNERLNQRLRDALAPVERALRGLGLSAREAVSETTALFAHCVGLLLLSHTGRIRMFGRTAEALLDRYLDTLIQRAQRPRPVANRS